ncbi:hypothetical protein CcI49_17120 [Frankia sp. CcI49]|nr:hypothetical protein CcI49_17120 [Frankia sp. CcI49]
MIAWDSAGRALVVDERKGTLVPASDPGDDGLTFRRLEERGRPGRIVPGDGWTAQLTWDHGGMTVERVLAWEIDANGNGGRPLFASPVGPMPLQSFVGVEGVEYEHATDATASTRA